MGIPADDITKVQQWNRSDSVACYKRTRM